MKIKMAVQKIQSNVVIDKCAQSVAVMHTQVSLHPHQIIYKFLVTTLRHKCKRELALVKSPPKGYETAILKLFAVFCFAIRLIMMYTLFNCVCA